MKCPTCESCEYARYCGATEFMRKCERHNKKVEQTNEEWFIGLSTEEKAKWIERIMFIVRYREEVEDGAYMQMMTKKDYIEMWLKQPHTAEE